MAIGDPWGGSGGGNPADRDPDPWGGAGPGSGGGRLGGGPPNPGSPDYSPSQPHPQNPLYPGGGGGQTPSPSPSPSPSPPPPSYYESVVSPAVRDATVYGAVPGFLQAGLAGAKVAAPPVAVASALFRSAGWLDDKFNEGRIGDAIGRARDNVVGAVRNAFSGGRRYGGNPKDPGSALRDPHGNRVAARGGGFNGLGGGGEGGGGAGLIPPSIATAVTAFPRPPTTPAPAVTPPPPAQQPETFVSMLRRLRLEDNSRPSAGLLYSGNIYL